MNINKRKLLNAVKNGSKALKQNNISDLRPNGPHKYLFDYLIPQGFFEIKDFMNALQLFLSEKELEKNLAKKTILMRFFKLLNVQFNESSPNAKLKELIDSLDRELSEIKEYRVYVPIRGIDMKDSYFKISNSIGIINLSNKNIYHFIRSRGAETYFAPFSIEFTAYGVDTYKIMETAIEASRVISSFLRFIDYQTWDEELLELRIPGYGVVYEELRVVAVDSSTGICYDFRHQEETNERFEIDEDFQDDWLYYGGNRFAELIDKFMNDTLEEIETQILRSIVLFGESKMETDDSMRLLKLMLIVECLLNLDKSEPTTATLSDNVAFILENTYQEREILARKMRKIYGVRSNIVHNGLSNLEADLLFELEDIVGKLLLKILTDPILVTLKNKNDLKERINIIKYS